MCACVCMLHVDIQSSLMVLLTSDMIPYLPLIVETEIGPCQRQQRVTCWTSPPCYPLAGHGGPLAGGRGGGHVHGATHQPAVAAQDAVADPADSPPWDSSSRSSGGSSRSSRGGRKPGCDEIQWTNRCVSVVNCVPRMWIIDLLALPRSLSPAPPSTDAVRVILREEGLMGFYRGLLPALLLTSHGAVQFAVYEQLKATFRASGFQDQSDKHSQVQSRAVHCRALL